MLQQFLVTLTCLVGTSILTEAQLPSFWNQIAKDELNKALNLERIEGRSKNVVFFLGDGMGVSTIAPARILKGETMNRDGERDLLSFETFPYAGLVKTYNTDRVVADSAGTATAFCSGIKTKFGVIGVDSRVLLSDCSSFKPEYAHDSFVKHALDAGKSIGIVTTARVTHATPAAAYAHSPDRDWENDSAQSKIPSNLKNRCPDIATQLITNGINFQVVLGGGRREFLMRNQTDPVDTKLKGRRSDRDLIELWKDTQKSKGRRYRYINTGDELRSLKTADVDYLFGLFANSHMDYELTRRENRRVQPSLTEMVTTALQILKRNDKGFILFVEAGRIDHGHHASTAILALYDTLELDSAVTAVSKSVDFKNTLMMTTADHSHVFTFGGYHKKGDPILGKVTTDFGNGPGMANDRKPFTSLLYANGPGGLINTTRQNVSNVNTQATSYQQQSLIPLSSETHGGEDVGVYARGPMAHLIHGTHEQHYLAHVIMYSACLGPYKHSKGCPLSSVAQFAPSPVVYVVVAMSSLLMNLCFCK